MKIEDVFSSRGRVKILRVLVKIGELNVSGIARRVGLNHTTTRRHLLTLEHLGLVCHKSFGRIRIYRLNDGSPFAKLVRHLVEAWEQTK